MISYVYIITVPCTLRMPRALGCERDPLQPQVSDVAGGNASKQCRATTCTRSPPALDLRIDAMMSAHRMQCECRDESSTWRLSDHRRRLSSKRVVRVRSKRRERENRDVLGTSSAWATGFHAKHAAKLSRLPAVAAAGRESAASMAQIAQKT